MVGPTMPVLGGREKHYTLLEESIMHYAASRQNAQHTLLLHSGALKKISMEIRGRPWLSMDLDAMKIHG